jgi:CheY-like chemotaxis protein
MDQINKISSVNILLVEDDEVDVKNFIRTFKELKIANRTLRAIDGVEALQMLRGQEGHAAIPHPFIIVLDLNMPRMGGLEFLDVIRKDRVLHGSVVFVMTTSAAEEDRVRAYNHNVAGYILKENPGHTFMQAISMLEHYWRIVELPH